MQTFTPELGDAIIRDIGKGAPYHIVAEANGIYDTTLHYWLKTGIDQAEAKQKTEMADFATRLRRAELRLINSSLKKIRLYPKGWKNHAWMLEHVYPRYYGSNVIELERIQRELAALTQYVQNQNKVAVMQKPFVKIVDDTVNCTDSPQGDDNGIS